MCLGWGTRGMHVNVDTVVWVCIYVCVCLCSTVIQFSVEAKAWSLPDSTHDHKINKKKHIVKEWQWSWAVFFLCTSNFFKMTKRCVCLKSNCKWKNKKSYSCSFASTPCPLTKNTLPYGWVGGGGGVGGCCEAWESKREREMFLFDI